MSRSPGRAGRWAVGVAIAAVAALARPVRAQPVPTADVRWRAPAGCPDQAAVRARLDERLAQPLGAGDVIDADIVVERVGRGYRARLRVWTPVADVERELHARGCAAVADAVAVVLARAVAEARAVRPAAAVVAADEPGAGAAGAESVAEGGAVPPLAPPGVAAAGLGLRGHVAVAPERSAVRGELPRWNGGVRIQVVSGAGVVPRVGTAGEVAAWAAHRWAVVELGASRWSERLAPLAPGGRFGAAVELNAGIARLCWQPDVIGPRTCAIGEIGAMRGRGVGLAGQRDVTSRWSAVGVGLNLSTRLRSHFLLVAGFEMMRSIDRPRFVLDRGTVLHHPDGMVGRVAIGLAVSGH